MKKFIVCCISFSIIQAHSQHKLKINTPQQLQAYFQYTGNDIPLVSGHRGGPDPGYPENCIATLEHTLQYTPATFEIDTRLTKDSVIVLLHDATLDRTTTGTGKLKDHTWADVQQLKLKDLNGNITEYKIPTLEETIKWAKGKTVLILDNKEVPKPMLAKLIKTQQAEAHVMVIVHNAKDALIYHKEDPAISFEAYVHTEKAMHEYEEAGIPWKQVMAYTGNYNKPENRSLYDQLHKRGVMCMVATAVVYDKLPTPEERAKAYRAIIENGADMIEADRAMEVATAIKTLAPKKSKKKKFFSRI